MPNFYTGPAGVFIYLAAPFRSSRVCASWTLWADFGVTYQYPAHTPKGIYPVQYKKKALDVV
jgi:hypothetical protein